MPAGAGTFVIKLSPDTFVRLHSDNQPVGSEPLVANRENIVRHVAKLYNDLGSASGQPFARAQIERHAAPTPIGDLTFDRNKRFGRARIV